MISTKQTPDWTWFEGNDLRAFPVSGIDDNGNCRCSSGKDCTSPGKHPKYKGWHDSAGTQSAYDRWRVGDNLGVATGGGLVVLDWDGVPTVPSSATMRTSTPSGGEHWFFRTLRPVRNGVKVFDGSLDIRGEGGFVVVPPSRHMNGGQYVWFGGVSNIVVPPVWVQKILAPVKASADRQLMRWPMEDPETESVLWTDLLDLILDRLLSTGSGERNTALFKAACEVAELVCLGGLSKARLTDVADAGVQIGLSVAEVKRTMTSAVGSVAG